MQNWQKVFVYIFTLICVLLALLLAHRAWLLRPLFFDPSARAELPVALAEFRNEQGIGLSHLDLRGVTCTHDECTANIQFIAFFGRFGFMPHEFQLKWKRKSPEKIQIQPL